MPLHQFQNDLKLSPNLRVKTAPTNKKVMPRLSLSNGQRNRPGGMLLGLPGHSSLLVSSLLILRWGPSVILRSRPKPRNMPLMPPGKVPGKIVTEDELQRILNGQLFLKIWGS